jgi:hypothetical protein
MIISHSRKFIFIHIHKTAGESISETLRPTFPGGISSSAPACAGS